MLGFNKVVWKLLISVCLFFGGVNGGLGGFDKGLGVLDLGFCVFVFLSFLSRTGKANQISNIQQGLRFRV